MLRRTLVRWGRRGGQQPRSVPHRRRPPRHGPCFGRSLSSSYGNDSYNEYDDADTNRFRDEDDDDDDEDAETKAQRLREVRAAELREGFRQKKGRGWSDPWDLTEIMESSYTYETLPEWSPSIVSRWTQDRLVLFDTAPHAEDRDSRPSESTATETQEEEHDDGDGVDDDDAAAAGTNPLSTNHPYSKLPTLTELASLSLPPPGKTPPHPGLGQTKAYALHRKRHIFQHVSQRVRTLAAPKLAAIQALSDWQDQQDAVDVLFEDVEFTLKSMEVILSRHPDFGSWVERALELYLQEVAEEQKTTSEDSEDAGTAKDATDDANPEEPIPHPIHGTQPVPIFMDCFHPDHDVLGKKEYNMVPHILLPLTALDRDRHSSGRMVEEWELAACKTAKRIMVRDSTQRIAKLLIEAEETSTPCRIFVHGQQGCGKSAALAAIVASARRSGGIVLYLPNGDRLHKLGFYVEPNKHRPGTFDLPVLSQQVCQTMLDVHREELEGFEASVETLVKFFRPAQLRKMEDYTEGESLSLTVLLEKGVEDETLASMAYSTMVDVLMTQEEIPFYICFDEFNCLFNKGQYFHGDYDVGSEPMIEKVDGKEKTTPLLLNLQPIPYEKISLFQPICDGMALAAPEDYVDEVRKEPVLMKRGAIVVGTSESQAVPRKVHNALQTNVDQKVQEEQSTLHSVRVPRLSKQETEHMLYNYESVGVGKLRLDQGKCVMDSNEVAYLHMISAGQTQILMNAIIMD